MSVITFGPGKLLIGDAGAAVDFACSVNSLTITTSGDTSAPTYKLCGTAIPGVTTLGSELTGNVDVDGAEDALFQLSSEQAASVQAFAFTPNTTGADVLEARGQLLLMPLDFGADAYSDNLTSDLTWQIVGDIDYYRGGVLAWTQTNGPRAAAAVVVAASGATAGVPGAVTPAGSTPPATVAALIAGNPRAVTASPATAWTTGQYVQTGTAGVPGQAHWSGSAWVTGPTP